MENSTAARQYPCDQCRRRKVRCNYLSPCDRCQSHGLACTSSAPRKKRGRKQGSGVVIEQLQRETATGDGNQQDAMEMSSASAALGSPVNVTEAVSATYDSPEALLSAEPYAATPSQATSSFYTFDDFAQSLLNPSQGWPSNLSAISEADWSPINHSEGLNGTNVMSPPFVQATTPHSAVSTIAVETPAPFEMNEIVARGVDLFFKDLYPTYPILIENEVRSWLSSAPAPEPSDMCMLWALTATTLLHVDDWSLTLEQRMNLARSYIKLCRESRLSGTFPESPSFGDVVCSLFLALAYFELRQRTTSWVYVREGVTLATAAGLDSAATNTSISDETRLQHQRLYALLFVTERGASILDNFPVSIMTVPVLSEGLLPDESPGTILGLQRLCDLFSFLDLSFVRLWNDLSPAAVEDHGYIEFAHLQERLRQPMDLRGVSDIQRADILVTQQWLRLVFWQAELRLGLISTTSTDPAFTYEYPMEIASSLCDVVKSLPPVAIQVHGLGIFKKQFEIAYSLLDSLTFSRSNHASTYYETLRYLLFSLSASPTSQQIYVKTLEKKIGSEQKYQRMSDVQLLRIDGSNRSLPPANRLHLSSNRRMTERLNRTQTTQ